MTDLPLYLAAFALAAVATGRATRLAVHDHYPPAAAVRRWWWARTWGKGGWRAGWGLLLVSEDGDSGCPFCFAPYAAAVNLAWLLLAGVELDGFWSHAWWIVNAWAALSYLAAIVYAYDQPAED